MFFLWLIVAVFIFDQITKWSIHYYMDLFQSISIIDGFLYLTYVTNDGMAFGLSLPGGQIVLSSLSILMTFVLIYIFWTERNGHIVIKLALSLIIAGALGNLFDRIYAGKVIDFLHVKLGSYWEWYIFNVADTSVSIGMIFFLYHSFFIQNRTENISD